MARSISVLLMLAALSGLRIAAAAPPTRAATTARPPRGRALVAPQRDGGHRLRTGDADSRAKATGEPRSAARTGGASALKVTPTSVGHPNDGRLEGGVRLDTSRKEIRVVPMYAAEDVRWGLPALVSMIERAARTVAKRFPGSVLEVGDLSRRGGGEVHRHHSHESGRDADLGFYAIDARGKQVHAKTFIQFNPRLVSVNVPGARFELARNWLLVESLLTDPGAHVSHIFIAEPLRYALLMHAKHTGVSRALLVRAELAMMQPTGAEPHDDHLHVRISCPRATHSSCIELAKNAPMGRARLARAARRGQGGRVLKTPGAHAHTRAHAKPEARPSAALTGEPPARAVAVSDAETRASEPPRDAPEAPSAAGDAEAPAMSSPDVEAASDENDAGAALDDSGELRITD